MSKLRDIKTFEDFLTEVAKSRGWEDFENLLDQLALDESLEVNQEAAELYAQYRAEQAIADYEKSKWVSVDEALPDLGVKVITDSGNGQYNIASFYADQNRWVNVSGHTLSHVIKWSKIL